MYLQDKKPTSKMSEKSALVARRAWRILRLALLWARKGGLFKHRLTGSLSVLMKVIRKLVHSNEDRGALHYGDREFSFDDTPILHVKMHRPMSSRRFKMPHIPCINPHVDFDYDFKYDEGVDDDDEMCCDGDCAQGITSFLKNVEEEEEEDEEIDLKAEQFIAKFYEQMKLQRQISYLEYNNDS